MASEIEPGVVARLDLKQALLSVVTNDLLPPRPEDKVGGAIDRTFLSQLRDDLRDRKFKPTAAEIIAVPKAGLTSRPAALLSFSDRVVFEALVALVRPRLAKRLMPPDVVYWPREEYSSKRWREFLNVPLQNGAGYVVEADIAGFYDSVNHQRLERDVVSLTGDGDLARGLRWFLDEVMVLDHGLPQGLRASDTLATLYLQPVDAAMVRDGRTYRRHGDDIRCAVTTSSEARRMISALEAELRQRGLLLNSSKLKTLTAEQYNADLTAGERTMAELARDLVSETLTSLSEDTDAFSAALDAADMNQLGWDVFYHGDVSLEVAVEELRPHIRPADEDRDVHAFSYAMDHAPDTDRPLPKEVFHILVQRMLPRLAAHRSPRAIQHIESLVARFPEKTAVATEYLNAVAGDRPIEVVALLRSLLVGTLFLTPWQIAWLLRVLIRVSAQVPEDLRNHLRTWVADDANHWIVRVEALKILATLGDLSQDRLLASWRNAPRQYRSDIVEGATLIHQDWAERFLTGTSLDPVDRVVSTALQARAADRGTLQSTGEAPARAAQMDEPGQTLPN